MWSGWRPGGTPSIPPRGTTWSVNACRSASPTPQPSAVSSPSPARQPTSSLLSSLTRRYTCTHTLLWVSSKSSVRPLRVKINIKAALKTGVRQIFWFGFSSGRHLNFQAYFQFHWFLGCRAARIEIVCVNSVSGGHAGSEIKLISLYSPDRADFLQPQH